MKKIESPIPEIPVPSVFFLWLKTLFINFFNNKSIFEFRVDKEHEILFILSPIASFHFDLIIKFWLRIDFRSLRIINISCDAGNSYWDLKIVLLSDGMQIHFKCLCFMWMKCSLIIMNIEKSQWLITPTLTPSPYCI